MSDDEPRDPFLDEEGGPYHHALRKGEMVFLGLAEIDSLPKVLTALKDMSEADLKCVVLERLYTWHGTHLDVLDFQDWLKPPGPEDADEDD